MDGHRAPVSRRASLLLAIPPLAFIGLFFVWPLIGVLRLGLAAEEEPLGLIARVWTDAAVVDVILFTIGLAIVSTVLVVALGLPAAWAFARFDFRGRRLLRALTVVPFVLPTVVVGAAFLALLGPRNPLNALATLLFGAAVPQVRLDGSVIAILIAHVFFNLSVVVRLVGDTWERLDPRVEEAARLLGASPLRAFREVTWPRLLPSILSAASIVLLFTATSFGVILLLGGPRDTTLEVEIYRQAAIRLDLPTAAALTLIQLIGVGALLLVSARAQERARDTRADPGAVGDRATAADATGADRRRHDPRPAGRVHRAAARDPRRAFARRAGRLRLRCVVGAPRQGLAHAAPRRADRGRRGFADLRRDRDGHRHGARALCRDRRRVPARMALPRARHARDAAARDVGGHRRVRVPRGPRPRAGRPAHLGRPHPARPRSHRLAIRPARGRADRAVDRPAAPRGCDAPRRLTVACVASGRCADPRARGGDRRGVRVRGLARRVRRDALHRSTRVDDDPGRDLPAARPTRRDDVRDRDGARDDPPRAHGARRCSWSTACACPARACSDGRGSTTAPGESPVFTSPTAGARSLRGVDLAVPEAGLVCVLGPSGSGKTTLLRAIAGLETPDRGHDDDGRPRPADGASPRARRRPDVPGLRPLPAPRRRR